MIKNSLFIDRLLEDNTASIIIKEYNRGTIIFSEGEACSSIGIIIDGNVSVQNITISGKISIINTLIKGNTFGELLLFADNHYYPANIIADSFSVVAYISKDNFIDYLHNNSEMYIGFLKHLSNNFLMVNERIKLLNKKTIRERIACYVYAKYVINKDVKISLDVSKTELANFMGVERPSLMRELLNMKNQGIIDYNRKEIIILDINRVCNLT